MTIDAAAHPKVLRFNRRCVWIALAFLVLTIGAKTAWRFHSGFTPQDFPQYYMAGVIARHGEWSALYPIPLPNSPRNPGFIEDSTMKPRYEELARERGVANEVRYMQPPPFALLLAPLGYLPYRPAFIVWNVIMTLCAWGIAVQGGRIFEWCIGRASSGSGWIILLIATSPQAHRWVRVQNMSALVGFLIGFTALDLVRRRGMRGSIAVWLAGLSKYIGIALVPLYVIMRRWKALILLAILSIAMLGISVAVMGWPVFNEFLHVIAPTLGRSNSLTGNQSIQGFLLRVMHTETLPPAIATAVSVAQVGVLLLLLALMIPRKQSYWKYPPNVFAAACALVLWMLLFSPIFWEHYNAYVAPFWGWMAWEATRGRIRAGIVIAAIALVYVPTPILNQHFTLPEPLASHLLVGGFLMFALAVYRLTLSLPQTQTNCSPSQSGDSGRCSEAVPQP